MAVRPTNGLSASAAAQARASRRRSHAEQPLAARVPPRGAGRGRTRRVAPTRAPSKGSPWSADMAVRNANGLSAWAETQARASRRRSHAGQPLATRAPISALQGPPSPLTLAAGALLAPTPGPLPRCGRGGARLWTADVSSASLSAWAAAQARASRRRSHAEQPLAARAPISALHGPPSPAGRARVARAASRVRAVDARQAMLFASRPSLRSGAAARYASAYLRAPRTSVTLSCAAAAALSGRCFAPAAPARARAWGSPCGRPGAWP